MSALVCGKRHQFDDLSSPGSSPPATNQKRARYRSGGSPSRYFTGAGTPAEGSLASTTSVHEKLLVLHRHFPSMNSEDLQRALEECGHDLDLTIEGLNLLCLAPSERGRDSDHRSSRSHGSPEDRKAAASIPGLPAASAHASQQPDHSQNSGVDRATVEAQEQAGAGTAAALEGNLSQQASSAEGGAERDALGSVLSVEWVDAVVQEMMSAKELDDARQRAARVLQTFGSAVMERVGTGRELEVQHLRQQLVALQRDNQILKRAVAIQHERHVAHEAREAEVANLKQMLGQYQEQLRKLEVNNYALSLHLQKAQVDNSLPSRFHPDVF